MVDFFWNFIKILAQSEVVEKIIITIREYL